jgi:hypothetical protein
MGTIYRRKFKDKNGNTKEGKTFWIRFQHNGKPVYESAKSTKWAEAHLVAREACVIAGVGVAGEVFLQVNPDLQIETCVADGDNVEAMTNVLIIKGSAKSILTAERTALNFIQRMCGVASITAEYVKAAGNPEVDLLCTRKTTPHPQDDSAVAPVREIFRPMRRRRKPSLWSV